MLIKNKKHLKDCIDDGLSLVFITESNPLHREDEGQERKITYKQGNAFTLGTMRKTRKFEYLTDDMRIRNRTPIIKHLDSWIYYKDINVSDGMIIFKKMPDIRIRVKVVM